MSHKHSNPNTQGQKLNKVPSWTSSKNPPGRNKEDQNLGQTKLHHLFPELVPITNHLADAAQGAQFSGQAMYTTTDPAGPRKVFSDVSWRDTERDFWFKPPMWGDHNSRAREECGSSELISHNKPQTRHSIQKLVIKPFKQRTVAEALLEKGDEVKEPMSMKRPSLWKDSTGLRGTRKSWRELRED